MHDNNSSNAAGHPRRVRAGFRGQGGYGAVTSATLPAGLGPDLARAREVLPVATQALARGRSDGSTG
jgi:hypothetical protein